MIVKSKGPDGNAMGTLWVYGRGVNNVSVTGDDAMTASYGTFVDISLDRHWKAVAFYYPTISFSTTWETPYFESEGRASGYVGLSGFDSQ